jgi:small ubiquitin-related modifier
VTTWLDFGLSDYTFSSRTGSETTMSDDETLTLHVRAGNNESIQFKVKKTILFKKIFEAYAAKTGVNENSFRLLFDGVRINENETPKMLEMVDGDQIDALIQATGGMSDNAEPSDTLMLNVKPTVGDIVQFRVKKTTTFEKIFAAYSAKAGVALGSFRFVFDGQLLKASDTPKMLELEDGDQIDAQIEQTGGSVPVL